MIQKLLMFFIIASMNCEVTTGSKEKVQENGKMYQPVRSQNQVLLLFRIMG
jgi:hypothetical protein